MTVGHSIIIDDCWMALDPTPLIEHFESQGKPYDHVQKCNRFILPIGKEHGRGWILMRASDVDKIQNWSSYSHNIRFLPSEDGENQGFKIEGLGILRVYSVTGYTENSWDASAGGQRQRDLGDHFVIVEFVDRRYSYRLSTINKQYNVRAYNVLDASDQPTYWQETLNNGYPWTWLEIIDDLLKWAGVGSLSSVNTNGAQFPQTNPENLKFPGLNAWDALCEVLDQTGHTIWRLSEEIWFIAALKDNPFAFTSEEYMRQFLEDPGWDQPSLAYEPNGDPNSLSVPKEIVVYFPTLKHDWFFESDPLLVDGGDVHDVQPLYVSYGGDTGDLLNAQKPHTAVGIYAPLFATYDESGNLTNGTALSNMATQMKELYRAAKGWNANSRHNIYLYYHNLSCGTDISAIQWYNTGNGSRTEIIRNPFKYVPGDEFSNLGRTDISEALSWENFASTNEIRKHNHHTRFAVVRTKDGPQDNDIPPNGVGQATVLRGSHSGNGSIIWQNSIQDPPKSIYVHEVYGKTIPKGTRITCYWHIQTRRWIAIYFEDPPCVPKFYSGTLSADMCPSEDGESSDLVDICDCSSGCGSGSGTPTTLKNPYKLAGRTGKKVFVYHTSCGQAEECVVLQVEHEAHELVENDWVHTEPDCTTQGDVTAEICKLQYAYREYSVMTCKSNNTKGTLLEAEYSRVLTNWWVDGLEIKGRFKHIWTMCACLPYDATLHIGTDCAYGSGSGGTQ